MTVIQKRTDNPVAHLTDADIEAIGRELDALRDEVFATLGEEDAAYIRRVIKAQRAARDGLARRAAVRVVPAGLDRGHGRAVGGQDPREHGDRAQHPARAVGLDARPGHPLHHLGVGQRRAGGHVEALAQRDPPPLHQRGRARQRPRLRDHACRRGPALDASCTLGQPLYNFVNMCPLRVRASLPTTSSSVRTTSARRRSTRTSSATGARCWARSAGRSARTT